MKKLVGWRYVAFIGGLVGTIGLACYPIIVYPMMYPEEYKKIQAPFCRQLLASVREKIEYGSFLSSSVLMALMNIKYKLGLILGTVAAFHVVTSALQVTRKDIRQEDIQPGNMKVWTDPFGRSKDKE